MRTFLDTLEREVLQPGWEHSMPLMLARWSALVDEVEEGYGWEIEEYDNELGVRDRIEAVLTAPVLQGFAELGALRCHVDLFDERFLAATNPMPEGQRANMAWWWKRVPRHAGPVLSDDFARFFGIAIPVVGEA